MKIVVYTQRVEIVASYGERRDCADQRIGDFIKACGFLPMPLRNNPDELVEIVRLLRPGGIILTGGNSLVKYGGDAPERDATDKECIKLAMEWRLPVFGFCRGMQSLLDCFGEKLSPVEGHVATRHAIGGKIEREVNSYHGQACVQLRTDNFEVLAQAADGVIEAVQHRRYPFLGTMWHPEREDSFRREDIQIAQALFGESKGEDVL